MNKIKTVARAEIEFDAQGLEEGQIEFELEGNKWVACLEGSLANDRIGYWVRCIKYAQEEFACGWPDALRMTTSTLKGI
ncbi:MAG: hypothetical protein WBH57_05610 [Anaerolineae bacterium]